MDKPCMRGPVPFVNNFRSNAHLLFMVNVETPCHDNPCKQRHSQIIGYTKILEVNLFAFAYRLFHRDFSPINGTYCMGTQSFLQLYMHFVLIWEGFKNG